MQRHDVFYKYAFGLFVLISPALISLLAPSLYFEQSTPIQNVYQTLKKRFGIFKNNFTNFNDTKIFRTNSLINK